MKRLAIAGLVLLVVIAVAAPVVTGSITRSSWSEMSQAFNASGGGAVVLENVEYDQGYLSTDVLSKLTLHAPEFEQPVEVFLRSGVAHGLTSARIETRLDPARHEAILALFDKDQPVSVSHAYMNGDFETQLTVPAVDAQQADIAFRWSPLSAGLAMADNGDSAQMHLTWDGLEAKQGEDFIRLRGLSLAEDMSRLVGEVWAGTVTFDVAELSGKLPESGAFKAENITLLAETRQSDGSQLENQIDLAIAALQTDEQPFGKVRMRFLAEGFDIDATNEVLLAADRMGNVDSNADAGEQAVQQLERYTEVMAAVRNLMAHGLEVGVPVMTVETPQGPAEMEFEFSHPELREDQREAMGSLLQHSMARLSLNMPTGLVDHLPFGLQQQLFRLYQQGILLENSGQLQLRLELDGMTLNINGQPVPIPPLI